MDKLLNQVRYSRVELLEAPAAARSLTSTEQCPAGWLAALLLKVKQITDRNTAKCSLKVSRCFD